MICGMKRDSLYNNPLISPENFCKKHCEGRALTVAKAALPSRTPPGHAEEACEAIRVCSDPCQGGDVFHISTVSWSE